MSVAGAAVIAVTLALAASPSTVRSDPGPYVAASAKATLRIVVSGRLLDRRASIEVLRSTTRTVRIKDSRRVKVLPGTITLTPLPITAKKVPSTATPRRVTVKAGTVTTVRIRYRKDTTSLTGPLEPLITDSEGTPLPGGSISPDGSKVAFTTLSEVPAPGGLPGSVAQYSLHVRDVTAGTTKTVADGVHDFVWSPDSSRLLVQLLGQGEWVGSPTPGATSHVADLASGTLQQVSLTVDGTPLVGGTIHARWVGDPDRIVFRGCLTEQDYSDFHCGLYVKTLTTGETREVLNADTRLVSWTVSPDGRRIAYTGTVGESVPGEYDDLRVYYKTVTGSRIMMASSNKKGKPANHASGGAVWSPDGTRIAFRSMATNLVKGDTNGRRSIRAGTDVFVKNLTTGAVKRVSTTSRGRQVAGDTAWGVDGVSGYWSPDGKEFAFPFSPSLLGRKAGRYEERPVFIKRITSGRLDPLVPSRPGQIVQAISYAPGSRKIAFLAEEARFLVPYADNNLYSVFVVSRRTGRIVNVSTRDDGLGWRAGSLDRSAEGHWVLTWLTKNRLVFPVADYGPGLDATNIQVVKTIRWNR